MSGIQEKSLTGLRIYGEQFCGIFRYISIFASEMRQGRVDVENIFSDSRYWVTVRYEGQQTSSSGILKRTKLDSASLRLLM